MKTNTVNNVLMVSSDAAVVYLFLHDIAFSIQQLMKVTIEPGNEFKFLLSKEMQIYFHNILSFREKDEKYDVLIQSFIH